MLPTIEFYGNRIRFAPRGCGPYAPNLVIRDSPAFWSFERLEKAGVTNCGGFDETFFRLQAQGVRDRFPTADCRALEQQALNKRRAYFLMLAGLCWRPTLASLKHAARTRGLRGLIDLAQWNWIWFRLWLREQLAGPVTTIGRRRW